MIFISLAERKLSKSFMAAAKRNGTKCVCVPECVESNSNLAKIVEIGIRRFLFFRVGKEM